MPARDHCGVVGVSLQGKGAAPYLFRGLFAPSSIVVRVVRDRDHEPRRSSPPQGHGSRPRDLHPGDARFPSRLDGIGHVRYPTTGSTDLENAQPIVFKVRDAGRRTRRERRPRELRTDPSPDPDSRASSSWGTPTPRRLPKRSRSSSTVTRDLDAAIRRACPELIGGYAVVMIVGNRIYAVPRPARDPPARLRDGRGRRRGRERVGRARADGREADPRRASR